MAFVTVNCAPMTAGDLMDSIQVTGGVKLSVDCNMTPTAFVGQERMISFPLDLEVNDGITSPVPMSATL